MKSEIRGSRRETSKEQRFSCKSTQAGTHSHHIRIKRARFNDSSIRLTKIFSICVGIFSLNKHNVPFERMFFLSTRPCLSPYGAAIENSFNERQ